MIICILGGVGSGKSLTLVKKVAESKNYPITNFKLKHIDYHRLKYSDIVKGKGKDISVNWDFWNSMKKLHDGFSIYLDEIPTFYNARAAMSKRNQVFSRWLSQIRKITMDSEYNHLYVAAQKLRQIDILMRELAHIFITCQKVTKDKKIFIINRYYTDLRLVELNARPSAKIAFRAEPYFNFYDTKELISFGDEIDEYV